MILSIRVVSSDQDKYVKETHIKCDVLLWIKLLEQCGSRIAVIV